MADLTSIGDFISNLSGQASAWYRGITGVPVVVPTTNAQLAAQQQLAIQQQAQATLTATNPALAGILANPTAILVIVLGIGAVFYAISRK